MNRLRTGEETHMSANIGITIDQDIFCLKKKNIIN